ncbi:MAG: glycine--tRNA ligase, partial [Planctomycetia bacterium]|nr:glycine--tRNA ligase [Planctomycetia bacterium]
TDIDGQEWPECGGEPTEPKMFNLMFRTFVGPVQDEASMTYLRPETAQGIFTNFANVLNTSRMKLPFGIAQIGKSFRNEITPRNFIFRTREFEQMEIEFFCKPGTEDEWWEHWTQQRMQWYLDLGIAKENLRFREHDKQELAHYAVRCVDIEYKFPWGWAELEGIGNRTDYDLKQHQRGMKSISRYADAGGNIDEVELVDEKQDMGKGPLSYFDDDEHRRYIPYVIEPSAGVDRSLLAFLIEAYDEEEVKGETRTVLRLSPPLAPIKVAVFPLVKKDGMPEKARKIYDDVRKTIPAFYDEKGAVGRRYRRQDEAGTPFAVTVDGQTADDNTVTLRERDSMVQERIDAGRVLAYVRDKLSP